VHGLQFDTPSLFNHVLAAKSGNCQERGSGGSALRMAVAVATKSPSKK
jgi:hypothetical protein